jgi:hypothetical protein
MAHSPLIQTPDVTFSDTASRDTNVNSSVDSEGRGGEEKDEAVGRRYHSQTEFVMANMEEMENPDNLELLGAMMEVETIMFPRVRRPQELARDSRLVLALARAACNMLLE